MKQNCWEYKKCCRGPKRLEGPVRESCPAYTEIRVDEINGGKNGGRVCWAISGTLCGEEIKGTFAKNIDCRECDFYKKVRDEEGEYFIDTKIFYLV